ncbi:hypothetical protein [Peribacillus tepidiphilus]|jgi:Ca2+/Na+ antiporter|uniref:hypothetical protein n=1 Tax=Peribacillus tepidiphilus TaxID=2652445 RepID=UPI0035B55DCC
MELGVKKKIKRDGTLQTWTGFLSFVVGLIALAGLNAALLLETEAFPETVLVQLPLIGLFLGIVGLFTRKRSRLYAWWGIGICVFLFVFTFMMFGLAWSINPKP